MWLMALQYSGDASATDTLKYEMHVMPHMVSRSVTSDVHACTPVGYRDLVCSKGINAGGSICFVPVLIKFKLESWL